MENRDLNYLIEHKEITPITGKLVPDLISAGKPAISRICHCCGCGEVGTPKYDDVWNAYPPKLDGAPIAWTDQGNIVVGALDKDAPLPEFGNRGHLLLESKELNFLIVWDDV